MLLFTKSAATGVEGKTVWFNTTYKIPSGY